MAEPNTPSPIEAPPPAYEVSQLDFDQKIAIAAERSLDLSEQRHHREQDDAAFEREDALGKSRQSNPSRDCDPQSVGRAPTVRPLAFKKKSRKAEEASASIKEKERPSWFEEAQLGASTSIPGVSRRPLPVPGQTREPDTRSQQQHVLPEDSDDDQSGPPPPFAPVDNSLDGPPYEAYASNDLRRRRTGNTVVLRYTGEDLAASPPPSPPLSPITHHPQNLHLRQRAASPQINTANSAYSHIPQQSRLQVQAPLVRPRSAEPLRYAPPPPPRLSFDHSIAYETSRQSNIYGQLPTDPEETARDATALYSSAVVPHLTSQKARPVAPPVKRRYTPSVASLPEYDQPQQHPRRIPAGKSLYAVQDYAASRASIYTQSSVNSVQQYPQMAQYPTQQNYTRPMSGDSQRWSTVSEPYQSQYYPR